MIYCKDYLDEINQFSQSLDTSFLQNCKILISGGTGLIGSYLIDSLLSQPNLKINITCLTTNPLKAMHRFENFAHDTRLNFYQCNLNEEFEINEEFDYILHLASFTDPSNYAKYPVETMLTNIIGTKTLLNIASKCHCKKFLLASSCEVYGTSQDPMVESNCGTVNPLDVRSCYNESKRAAETLCVSYSHEYNINSVIARISRAYGPTMLMSDTKALSQFIKKALQNENIVLKSKGDQIFSYCYVSDVVSALMLLLKNSENATAYNVSDPFYTPSLKEIATKIASFANTQVVFEEQSEQEKAGYSRATKSILPIDKITLLGWKPLTHFDKGIMQTNKILKQIYARK